MNQRKDLLEFVENRKGGQKMTNNLPFGKIKDEKLETISKIKDFMSEKVSEAKEKLYNTPHKPDKSIGQTHEDIAEMERNKEFKWVMLQNLQEELNEFIDEEIITLEDD